MDSKGPDNQTALTEYLVKEIELNTNLMASQRAKNNLIFVVAPFVVLGVIAGSSEMMAKIKLMSHLCFVALNFLSVMAFVFLGYIGANIEEKLWDQNNKCRRQIANINNMDEDVFVFASAGVHKVYFAIFVTVGVLFSISMYMIRMAA